MMWIVYLIGLFDSLKKISMVLTTILMFFGIVGCIFIIPCSDTVEELKKYWKTLKKVLIATLCSLVLTTIFPSKETSITMAAVYVGEKVVTSDTVANLTETSVDYLMTWIQTEKQELENKKNQQKKELENHEK